MVVRQSTVVEKMAENEELIGCLYQTYAGLYPEYTQFWSGMATEENKHAAWLKQLASDIEAGRVNYTPDRFNAIAVQTQIDYLHTYIRRARELQIPLIELSRPLCILRRACWKENSWK